MGGGTVQPQGLTQFLIPIAVIAVVFVIRGRQMMRVRKLRLGQLWVVPALYLAIVASTFAQKPPSPTGWLVSIVALAVGAGIGWYRGKLIAIHVDPETQTLQQRASPLAMLFLFAIVMVKVAAQGEGRAMHLDVALLTNAALMLALGTFAVARIEMYLRAKRLLAEAGAARLTETFR